MNRRRRSHAVLGYLRKHRDLGDIYACTALELAAAVVRAGLEMNDRSLIRGGSDIVWHIWADLDELHRRAA
jgi:hypothetical protein